MTIVKKRAYPYGIVRARILALFANGATRTMAECTAALPDMSAKVVAQNVAISATVGLLRNIGTRRRARYKLSTSNEHDT